MTLERDNLNPAHPSHRADTPYDWQSGDDFPIDGLDRPVLKLRVLFALGVFVALLVGLVCAAVGFVLDSTRATWTGVGLIGAGAVGLRVLWVGGQE